MKKFEVINAIRDTGIIAIMRGVPHDCLLPLADALYQGGIRVIEVTANSLDHLSGIRALNAHFGSRMQIGAGTILNPVMAQLAIDAGADFILAPDFNPAVVTLVHEHQRLMIPGIATPSEAMQAHRLGVDLLKLFPAGALGIAYLKDLLGPLNHAAIIPVGGINQGNVQAFSRAGAFAVGVGGELTRRKVVEQEDWTALSALAARFIQEFAAGKQS
ncbi:bifunctional 4-hydroxy-2-oxoglutarate aldolase/2-dehydro-3-deoxy-phosphogluconate aldolase [Sodalis sp. dw_96]|uniref:bifunctional 4-hydroxy-2-oxoglutarate aldolase/2-dehydro-3-deoxy-phosphogluconate aldolase n=1 Tax=Sodalis sp. dw_96 TaxID=2719794 RepID=UPI001BD6B253|nr:bifunctional 4-hydroxy-2-oxoglutarate aldolase/2-dehydro-3-deoxy-phosphogluconate aldolase [Sodalis sp. dw_96]